jgi:hypothetical protein
MWVCEPQAQVPQSHDFHGFTKANELLGSVRKYIDSLLEMHLDLCLLLSCSESLGFLGIKSPDFHRLLTLIRRWAADEWKHWNQQVDFLGPSDKTVPVQNSVFCHLLWHVWGTLIGLNNVPLDTSLGPGEASKKPLNWQVVNLPVNSSSKYTNRGSFYSESSLDAVKWHFY